MKDYKWFINRIIAMKPQEILWRLQQKCLFKEEKKYFYSLHKPVTEIPLPQNLSDLHIDIDRLSINWDNDDWTVFQTLDLFGVYEYRQYRKKWNAGFQTENNWPEDLFSPSINISQRTDIGDIRTNWELNRHFQFAALAKSYFITKDDVYLSEFVELFYDWNERNAFLHGVEWTSAMELAIRVNSWVYAFAFLKKAGCDSSILKDLEHGILVMIFYILKHRARYSSANNHLIIEMYAVALVGIIANYAPWKEKAIKVLTEELPKQNYADGVNKEMSLHYQAFVMEAYGLLWLLMQKNQIEIPEIWHHYLSAMTEFIADSTDDFGATMEFGDNDEGKILDLRGKIDNYYQYVLNLMGCLLETNYTDTPWHENLKWIVPQNMRGKNEKYVPKLVCSRKEGGYTFLRSKDRRILIGIDHGDLGFRSIAAHGHADALSFQIFFDGKPVFVDSGTYNYHYTSKERDYYRSTVAHNTVMADGKEQSEMLGPFIWGKRAKTKLVWINDSKLRASSKYGKYEHIRDFTFADRELQINDNLGCYDGFAFFHISPLFKLRLDDVVYIDLDENNSIKIYGGVHPAFTKGCYSPRYNCVTENINLSYRLKKNDIYIIQFCLEKAAE